MSGASRAWFVRLPALCCILGWSLGCAAAVGVMQTDTLISTLLSAAAFLKEPVRAIASQSLRDVYEATKYYLRRKFGVPSRGATALEMATDRPQAAGSKALLLEETAAAGLDQDPELLRLAEALTSLLAAVDAPPVGDVQVHGNGNRVQVAGSIVNTERHVSRNTITPDERHLTSGQCAELRRLITEVADRMADDSGAPNFAAVHRMLQRRFEVASYLLIPRELFVDALTFLKQVRGRHRRALRRRNPAAFEADLFRTIHARGRQLGWNRERVCTFATEKLGRHRPVDSLRELGVNQLTKVAEWLRRETAAVS